MMLPPTYHHHHHSYEPHPHHQGLTAAAALYPAHAHAAAAAAAMQHHAYSEPRPSRLFFKMPRVVPKQKERFEEEDIFKRNSREQEVRYTLYRDRPLQERQAKLQQGCREGHIELSHASTGLVMILTWNPMQNDYGERVRYGCDFHKEPGKVHLRCSLILNGVCVRWRGWLNMDRLDGMGCIEFDEEMAKAEDAILQQQIEYYNHRLKEIEAHHHHATSSGYGSTKPSEASSASHQTAQATQQDFMK